MISIFILTRYDNIDTPFHPRFIPHTNRPDDTSSSTGQPFGPSGYRPFSGPFFPPYPSFARFSLQPVFNRFNSPMSPFSGSPEKLSDEDST